MRIATLLTLVLSISVVPTARSFGLDEVEVTSLGFDKDVQPILTKYCAGCHNDEDPQSDFSVSSAKSLAAGMPEKQVLDAASPEASLLLRLMLGTQEPKMPPEEEPQPTSEEIESIRAWLVSGASLDSHSQDAMNELSIPTVPSLPVAPASKRYVSAALDAESAFIEGKFGKVTAYGNADRSKALWSNETFPGKVNALRRGKQGDTILVASGISGVGGEAQILNTRSGETIQRFLGHNDSIYCVALGPDGKLLATGSYDRKILLWDTSSGQVVRELSGHNGAIYDLDFDPSGKILATASADQTVKVWNVASGERLDTLGQPEGELRCVRFSPDGRFLFAGGADRQIRKWRVVSRDKPGTNPMEVARYAHESDILELSFADSNTLITTSTDFTAKAWDIERLEPLGTLTELDEVPVAVCLEDPQQQRAKSSSEPHQFAGFVVDLHGSLTELDFSVVKNSGYNSESISIDDASRVAAADSSTKMPFVNSEIAVEPRPENEPNNTVAGANPISLPSTIHGTIVGDQDSDPSSQFGDTDLFGFDAVARETWIIEANARGKDSKVDTLIDVLDAQGQPVVRTRLQALRESYFTFRGKDSDTSDDYRLHKWEDMELDEYLYSGGEVNRLWLYPRGPDSGFKVYPGYGKRHTFFGTTAVSHALGDVAYVVRELAANEAALPNGLPTFPIYFENDDDGRRRKGKNSYLRFTASESGRYHLRVRDARGFADPTFHYELSVRKPKPDFQLVVKNQDLKMPFASGREWEIEATRL
ncbi:MAG: WD40 repeat domain-containing protein, partial [Pirellulaceae bacterium]